MLISFCWVAYAIFTALLILWQLTSMTTIAFLLFNNKLKFTYKSTGNPWFNYDDFDVTHECSLMRNRQSLLAPFRKLQPNINFALPYFTRSIWSTHFTRGALLPLPPFNSWIKRHRNTNYGMRVGVHPIFLEKLVLSWWRHYCDVMTIVSKNDVTF